jgi:hypothetical protein
VEPAPARATPFPRAVAFFRRHPILLFLAFTPGIPEYLSGSSPTEYLVLSPGVFVLFLAFNLGLYGPGALLVREALVRWRKGWGWATALLLGTAYALLEEGTALSTLFNPRATVVGALGSYGHAYGVNWIWAIGIVQVHVLFSVGLPIVLLGLALPETRGRSLLSGRGIAVALGLYAIDITILALAVGDWRQDGLFLVLAATFAGLLWVVARCVPAGLLDPATERPPHRPRVVLVLGLLLFPLSVLVPGLLELLGAPALVTAIVAVALAGGLFLLVRHEIGRTDNRAHLTLFALGAILPLAVTGLIANVAVPTEIGVDVLVALFFYALWVRYRPSPRAAPPAGAASV